MLQDTSDFRKQQLIVVKPVPEFDFEKKNLMIKKRQRERENIFSS